MEQKRIYFIGRHGDIRLDHTSASRLHACLEVSDSRLLLRDLDSRNGTHRIIDGRPIPFAEGEAYLDDVFAFSLCIRSVRQMLDEVAETGDWQTRVDRRGEVPRDSSRKSRPGAQLQRPDPASEESRQRSQAKLARLLESARSRALDDVNAESGPSEGGKLPVTPNDDGEAIGDSVTALQHEVDALRKMLAAVSRERDALQRVSDLNLERLELQNELIARMTAVKTAIDMDTTSELPAMDDENELRSLDEHVALDRRFFVPEHRWSGGKEK